MLMRHQLLVVWIIGVLLVGVAIVLAMDPGIAHGIGM